MEELSVSSDVSTQICRQAVLILRHFPSASESWQEVHPLDLMQSLRICRRA
jgi:hypothetical protein